MPKKYKRDYFAEAHQILKAQGYKNYIQLLLPGGKMQGREWVVKNPTRNDNKAGSFSVNVDTGKWGEFSGNNHKTGGDLIGITAYIKGITPLEACFYIGVPRPDSKNSDTEHFEPIPDVNLNSDDKHTTKSSNYAPESSNEEIEDTPAGDDDIDDEVHSDLSVPEFTENLIGRKIKDRFKGGIITLYSYPNSKGVPVGCVIRCDFSPEQEKEKDFAQYSYDFEQKKWKSGWSKKGKPIYNLQELIANPDKPVMIVEGEKKVQAAKILFPEFVPITSCGGGGSANSTNWSFLKDRDVTIAPDNDVTGNKYIRDLKNILSKVEVKSISKLDTKKLGRFTVVDGELVKRDNPNLDKYDLADSINDGWTAELVAQAMKDERFKPLFVSINEVNNVENEDKTISDDLIITEINKLNQNATASEISHVMKYLVRLDKLDIERWLSQIKDCTKRRIGDLRKEFAQVKFESEAPDRARRAEQAKAERAKFQQNLDNNKYVGLYNPLSSFFEWKDIREDKDGKPYPIPTLENFKLLLGAYGIQVQYNLITHECEINVSTKEYGSDNKENAVRADITSICVLNDLKIGEDKIQGYLKNIADKNEYNPAENWINSKPWDQRSRLEDFFITVTVGEEYNELKKLYLRKWLLAATAAVIKKGFYAKGVLVFQGGQSLGKTAWFKRLLPLEMQHLLQEGANLDPNNKDSVMGVNVSWLVELGELDSTFKNDLPALKAFISSQSTKIRKPYDREVTNFTRRTVFFASVNEPRFLKDETGNVRWWVLPIKALNYNHNVDMQQLFAEMLVYLNKDEKWWLTLEEEANIEKMNEEFLPLCPFEELISSKYDFITIDAPPVRKVTTTEICIELGYDKPTKVQINACANALKKLGAVRLAKDKRFLLPNPKPIFSADSNYSPPITSDQVPLNNQSSHQKKHLDIYKKYGWKEDEFN